MHIMDHNGNISPSAFIPFCMFGGNASAMGVKIGQFKSPVCNSFRPKIFNDQLCYEVDVTRFTGKTDFERKRQLAEGLIMILDNNEDLQVV